MMNKVMMNKTNRVWIETLWLGAAVACALALTIATLGAAAGAASGEEAARQERQSPAVQTPAVRTYEGIVTCSRCGARHSATLGHTAADCTRRCVRGGANFTLVEADATYILEGDIGVLGRLAGRRARIAGELNGNTIRISSILSGS
jgi:hypothetical protein